MKKQYMIYPPRADKATAEYRNYMESFDHRYAGSTPEEAWTKFCYPALERSAYEQDGWYADEVKDV